MATPYERGRQLEYRVRDLLQSLGFWVVRSAGSRGLFDVYAVKNGFVLGVQCKIGNRFRLATLIDMLNVWKEYHIYPVLICKDKGKLILHDFVMRVCVKDARCIKKYLLDLYEQWKNTRY